MMSQVQNPANQCITKISFCRADNRFVDIITRFLIYTGMFCSEYLHRFGYLHYCTGCIPV